MGQPVYVCIVYSVYSITNDRILGTKFDENIPSIFDL